MRIERIESVEDERVAAFARLREGDLVRREGLFIGEGRLVVRRVLAMPRYEVVSLFVTDAALESLRDVLNAEPRGFAVYLASQKVMNDIVGFNIHRGCLSLVKQPGDLTFENVLERAERGTRLIVGLEDLTNHDNIGGLFRSAHAFGAGGVLLSKRCTDPMYRKAMRVSMGSVLSVPFARVEDWEDGLKRLKRVGYRLVALTPASDALALDCFAHGLEADSRMALLLGAEGPGLCERTMALCDARVRIPMTSEIDSLNVAMAGAIVMQRVSERLQRTTID